MSENPENKTVRNDEIDLLDLFRRMGHGLGNMFRWTGRAILVAWTGLGLPIPFVAGIREAVKPLPGQAAREEDPRRSGRLEKGPLRWRRAAILRSIRGRPCSTPG